MRSPFLAGIVFLSLAASGQPTAAADVRLFARFEVNDYEAWRKAYNAFNYKAFTTSHRRLVVTSQTVFRSVENPNDITLTRDFNSVEQAKAFVSSPDLKAAMDKAGVKGAQQVWITTRAK